MKVALVPMRVITGDFDANAGEFHRRFREALKHRPDVVVFPEYCLTGFEMWDFSGADLYDEIIELTENLASKSGVHIILGLLERDGNCIYNTAVMVSPEGRILLKHRKFQEPMKFCTGNKLEVASTPWGRVGIIICGDLYNSEILSRVRTAKPDYLFVPMEYTPDYGPLNGEDVRAMSGRVRLLGTTVLVVNSFPPGGAWVFERNGSLKVSSEGSSLLLVEV